MNHYNIIWILLVVLAQRKIQEVYYFRLSSLAVLLCFFYILPNLGDVANSYSKNYYLTDGIRTFEFGYYLLLKLGNYLSLDNESFFTILRVGFFCFWLYIFKGKKKRYLFFYSTFFFLACTNVIRQGISLCFLFGFIQAINDRKFTKSLVWATFSQLFHASAIFFISVTLSWFLLKRYNGFFRAYIKPITFALAVSLAFFIALRFGVIELLIRNNERFTGLIKPLIYLLYFTVTTMLLKKSKHLFVFELRSIYFYIFFALSLIPYGSETASRVLLAFSLFDALVFSESRSGKAVFCYLLLSALNISTHTLLLQLE